jgi:hypothetical protein
VFVKGKITFIMENCKISRHWWLTSVILATQEAEIRRIEVQSQPRQIVCETLSKKKKKKKKEKDMLPKSTECGQGRRKGRY